MEQYISKSTLVAEIEKIIPSEPYPKTSETLYGAEIYGKREICLRILDFLDTLEVKEAETWHLQEKENIYDTIKDWSLHTFACIMKDGTIQKFTGNLDEDCEGHINVHIDGVNNDYDNVDDIVKWIEFT